MQATAHKQHTAAIAIQSRFWLPTARWITRTRLCCQILHQGLDYHRLQNEPVPIDHFIKRLVFSPLANTLAAWLRRILLLCVRETDELCDDMQLLTTRAPGSAINRVLSAFLFALYQEEAIDRGLPGAEELYRIATQLCPVMDACIQTTHRDSVRDAGTKLVRLLQAFLSHHLEWRQHNEQIILRRLTNAAIVRMHSIISLRNPSAVAQGAMSVLSMRSMATLGDGGLPTMRMIATTGEIGPVRQTVFDTSAVRMLHRMADSELWGAHGLHTSRFAHELMIDPGFKISMEQTIPALSNKYASNRRAWCADELIFDAGTVIMWVCRRAEDIIDLAEAIDVYTFPELLSNLQDTVERIRRIACRIIAIPQFTGPDSGCQDDETAARMPLQRLLHHALALRNTVANTQINVLRQQSFTSLASYMHRLDHTHPVSISTYVWIQEAVMRCSRSTIADRLAHGDPFALLKLHDDAIINIVLERDRAPGKRYHGLEEVNTLPDILYFDLERMRSVYYALRTCPKDEFRTKRNFDRLFRELVTSGEGSLSEQVTAAAAKLRSMVFVCRHRHGNAIAKIAYETARVIAANEENAQRR
jgi:hypothetical protein